MTKTILEQFVEDGAKIHLEGPLRDDFEELFPKDKKAMEGKRPSKSNRSAALVLWGGFAHAIRASIKYTAMAFGGCTICYGKGYRTDITSADIKFCECSRGKQLGDLFYKTGKAVTKELLVAGKIKP